jgi:hypothetical protein
VTEPVIETYIVTTHELVTRVRLVEATSKTQAADLARRGNGDIEDHLSVDRITVKRVDRASD